MTLVAQDERLGLERLRLGPYGTNAYILSCRRTRESVLIDAPAEAAAILERLEGTEPRYILMTHGHVDHVGALVELKSRLQVPVAAHALEAAGLPLRPDLFLADGDSISFGRIELQVLHTPGHTPGGLCFLTGRFLLSGDTLFPGGPGKTWSPAGFRQLVEAIAARIMPLPDETLIFPGHGDSTTLGRVRPAFEAFTTRPHPPDLYGDVVWLSS